MKSQGPAEPSDLVSLLEKKIAFLEEFLADTESLYRCLQEGDTGKAGPLLEKRQSLARSVDAVDQQIEILQSAGSGAEGLSAPPLRQRDHQLWKAMESILRKAAEWDQKCLAQAVVLREEIKKEMTSIREGWKVVNRYVQRFKALPRFMDVRQ
ncbi:MAG: hypothetical protein AMJ94_20060 [Deltaproteobacteria bacterium SM23_61]|nr:MAG: hypothetical protein AMJ94_20060 [Deltaproteobacteria bacterium SM23_61]